MPQIAGWKSKLGNAHEADAGVGFLPGVSIVVTRVKLRPRLIDKAGPPEANWAPTFRLNRLVFEPSR